ncbi:MAG: T9SS type A sorting domain-containing protein [Bacteroidetes bacterium]|nr:T9SS type A sorting domain-containing protein [Bacteroidota bacterium]
MTGTFSGTPAVTETLNIKVTATDTAGASASTNLKIIVNAPSATDTINRQNDSVKILPNPTSGFINIAFNSLSRKSATAEIRNPEDKLILSKSFKNKIIIDLTDRPRGIYVLKLHNDHEMIVRNLVLNN